MTTRYNARNMNNEFYKGGKQRKMHESVSNFLNEESPVKESNKKISSLVSLVLLSHSSSDILDVNITKKKKIRVSKSK